MRNGIWIIAICMNACAWTPKDEAWKLSLETPRPPGVNGNCLPVAQALREKYGGEIAVVSNPKYPRKSHAVLVVDSWVFDNGTLGYHTHWEDMIEQGWKVKYWWTP